MNISGSIKKQNVKDELPAGWRRVRLGDIFNIQTGKSQRDKINNSGEFIVVDMGGVSTDGKIIEKKKILHSENFLQINDLVMPKDDIGHGYILGKVAIIKKSNKYVLGDHVFGLRNISPNSPDFLRILINSPSVNNSLKRKANGTSQKGLTKKEIFNHLVFLPNLEKQKQIASIISTWDDAIEKTELLIAAQEHQFKGLINSLLNDKSKQTNWTLAKLGEICDIKNGSTPLKTEKSFWKNGEVPWFTVADIRRQGRIINNTTQFITTEALKKSSIYLLPKNSILICCTASIGEHAFTTIPLTTNQQFNGLTIKKEKVQNIYPEYLFYASYLLKKELSKLGGKTSFMHVPVSLVANICLSIPPIKEQEKIITCLSTCQNIINQSQKLLNEYKRQKKALIQKLFYSQ